MDKVIEALQMTFAVTVVLAVVVFYLSIALTPVVLLIGLVKFIF